MDFLARNLPTPDAGGSNRRAVPLDTLSAARDDDGASTSVSQTISVGVVATAGATVCGKVSVPINSVVDSDVNDPDAPFAANDSIATAQALPNPASVAGYLNIAGAGVEGRSFAPGDPADFYRFTAFGGEVLHLVITNGMSSEFAAAFDIPFPDVDLNLYNENGAVLEASVGTGKFRTLEVPEPGNYFVEVVLNPSAAGNATLYGLSLDDTVAGPGGTGTAAVLDNGSVLVLSADFVPGDVVVAWKDRDRRAVAGALSADGSRTLSRVGVGGVELHRLNDDAGVKTRAAAGAGAPRVYASERLRHKARTLREVVDLRRTEGVRYAEPNYIRHSARVPNDPLYAHANFDQRWFMEAVRLPQAWDITTGSDAVIVAVLDSGTVLNHRELDGRDVPGYDFVGLVSAAGAAVAGGSADDDGYDADPTDPGPSAGCVNPDPFHGVQVAGVVAAETNNSDLGAAVTWAGRYMPVRVIGDCGAYVVAGDVAGGGGASFDIANGILFAAGLPNASGDLPDEPADVINMSFSSTLGNEFSRTEQDAVSSARAAGVVLVAAAGNDTDDTPRYPANYAGVIAVSATDRDNNLSPFSNTGPHIDLAAPGGDNSGVGSRLICTAGWSPTLLPGAPENAVACAFGTSVAAPIVSGVIALMKAVHPGLTPDDVDLLLAGGQMTDDLGAPGRDDSFGRGLLNAEKAVSAARALVDRVTAVPDTLDFGASRSVLTFELAYAGSDPLTLVSSRPSGFAALTITGPGTPDGLGVYTATLDRSRLEPGTEGSGDFGYEFSNGDVVDVSYSYVASVAPPAALQLYPPGQSVDLGYGLTRFAFEIRDAGGAPFTVASVGSPDEYLTVRYLDAADGLGRYVLEVDRAALTPGRYDAVVEIVAGNGGVLPINVSLRVLAPERVQPGSAGVLYAYALSSDGQERVAIGLGEGVQGFYAYTLTGLSGEVAISVSSDLSHDDNRLAQGGIPWQEGEAIGSHGVQGEGWPLSPGDGARIEDADMEVQFAWLP